MGGIISEPTHAFLYCHFRELPQASTDFVTFHAALDDPVFPHIARVLAKFNPTFRGGPISTCVVAVSQ